MNSAQKFLTLKIVVMVICFFAAAPIYGQDLLKECQAIYQNISIGHGFPTADKLREITSTAKAYLEKCGKVEKKEVVEYLTNQIPRLEQRIKEQDIREIEARFNKAVPAKNWDDAIAASKELINLNRPYSLDLMLVIATIGYDQAFANPPVDKYNDDAIIYARMALQRMREGAVSGADDQYGFFQFAYKTKDCEGKLNATGWMNYTIGYIMFVRQKQTKEALPYLYQATQIGCETKVFPEAYRLIGDWYLDEFSKLNGLRLENLKEANGRETDETKLLLVLQKGYAERALNAYAKAYKTVFKRMHRELYTRRILEKAKEPYQILYNGDVTGLEAYLENVMNAPLIDPVTPFSPKPNNN